MQGSAGGVADRAPVRRSNGQEDKCDQGSGPDSTVTAVVSATWAMKPATFHDDQSSSSCIDWSSQGQV